jgi:hypothetical protein
MFNEEPPHENSICRWDRQLKGTGRLLDKWRSGRPSFSDEFVENIRNSFIRIPKKSVRTFSRELRRNITWLVVMDSGVGEMFSFVALP